MSDFVDFSAEYLRRLFGLNGLTAVVIGGTGVLGSTIAETLGMAGAHVLVVGRDSVGAAETVARIGKQGGSAEFLAADATCQSDLEALVRHLEANGRKSDILVNGAGTNSPTPFLEITDEEWDRIFNVNLRSVRLACQVFGRHLLAQNSPGSIINIASLSAITPLSRVFTYSASKAAVLNLTQNLAREWALRNIRVNALSPGFFPAEQNRKVLTQDRIENVMRHTPMQRFGVPAELSGAILLMASPTAGSFLTGANIVVDGGFTAMTI
ncbi:MAG: uxuB [Planctomycetaceae bacterium]|nr:uxuB [Planctomycetaceae bacterium]